MYFIYTFFDLGAGHAEFHRYCTNGKFETRDGNTPVLAFKNPDVAWKFGQTVCGLPDNYIHVGKTDDEDYPIKPSFKVAKYW